MDTKLKRSTIFHPRTDGELEVNTKIMVHLLRVSYRQQPVTWDGNLPKIQH